MSSIAASVRKKQDAFSFIALPPWLEELQLSIQPTLTVCPSWAQVLD
jgi:hypothetical protein